MYYYNYTEVATWQTNLKCCKESYFVRSYSSLESSNMEIQLRNKNIKWQTLKNVSDWYFWPRNVRRKENRGKEK